MSLARIGDLTLRARRYEFPDGSDCFDRNWLNISVTLSGGAEPLSYQWPCLLTTDVLALRNQLDEIIALFPERDGGEV